MILTANPKICKNHTYINFYQLYKEIVMALSNPNLWLVVLPTWVTGAILLRLLLKKRSELKVKKVPVRVRVRSRKQY